MTLAVEMTDLRSEYEDTVFMYGSRLSQDGIQLIYKENDEDIPEIPCDPQRMRQVFLNILDNAAKHGGAGKRIETDMHFDGEQVIVRIRDFGPGIPEDELPLVKKKFYKGSSSVRGTGIGLAVCDEIVEMHGGTLSLENAEGGGTLVLDIGTQPNESFQPDAVADLAARFPQMHLIVCHLTAPRLGEEIGRASCRERV